MKIYCTTFCNKGHDIATGKPVDHECYVIPPKALEAERQNDFQTARRLIDEAKSKGPWLWRIHRGVNRSGNRMKYLKLKPSAETMLRDALYNMDSHSGASTDYAHGLVVGVVSTLMADGFKFEDAIDTIAQYMPNKRTTRLTVPPSWEHRLSACLLARGKMLDE